MSESCQAKCDRLFGEMVESVGVKAFAAKLGMSSRQVHRMLSGSQPNPLRRFCEVLQACPQAKAEAAMSCLCRQMGMYWVRVPTTLAEANLNAVKEAAEAIVAIMEGRSVDTAVQEIREAIAALSALERALDKGLRLSNAGGFPAPS